MRHLLSVALAAFLLSSCASVPPSREDPVCACQYDHLQRFRYVLVVQRDDQSVTWIERRIGTRVAIHEPEEHTTPASTVRLGYCPDEVQHFMTGKSPWVQTIEGARP